MRQIPRARDALQSVSMLFEGALREAAYVYQNGVVCVSWYNAVDYKRHQLSKLSSDPKKDAAELLRAMLIAAKFRGEL